jgi:hypothetical protein
MRALFFAFLISAPSLIFAQESFEERITKINPTCAEISLNAASLFEKYMLNDQYDSARFIVNYWAEKCGNREVVKRAKILLSLKTRNYSDTVLGAGILVDILDFKNRMDYWKAEFFYVFDNNAAYYGFVPFGQDYDRFTNELGRTLKKKYLPGTIPYILCDFYGGNTDSVFIQLQQIPDNPSSLEIEYKEMVSMYKSFPSGEMGGIAGVWVPTGRLEIMGVHPEIGFSVGVKNKKMLYSLFMSVAFIKTPNKYEFINTQFNDSLQMSNMFIGFNVGGQVDWSVYQKKGNELFVLAGGCYSGITVLPVNDDDNIDGEVARTVNLNIGLGVKHYFRGGTYISLQGKYNLVDYTSNGVIDYNGNAFSVQFIIGGALSGYKTQLDALQYDWR